MKAKAINKHQTISKGDEGKFVKNKSWQGGRIGRKKPKGYFAFENNSGGITKLSVHLVKNSTNFEIITNED